MMVIKKIPLSISCRSRKVFFQNDEKVNFFVFLLGIFYFFAFCYGACWFKVQVVFFSIPCLLKICLLHSSVEKDAEQQMLKNVCSECSNGLKCLFLKYFRIGWQALSKFYNACLLVKRKNFNKNAWLHPLFMNFIVEFSRPLYKYKDIIKAMSISITKYPYYLLELFCDPKIFHSK